MDDQNGSTTPNMPGQTNIASTADELKPSSTADIKGKGKAIEVEEEDDDDDDDDEDSDEDDEDDVPELDPKEELDDDRPAAGGAEGGEGEGDGEIGRVTTDNIIWSGRRTRGKNIDFAKAAEEAGDDLEEDEDDDEDFEMRDDDEGGDRMEE